MSLRRYVGRYEYNKTLKEATKTRAASVKACRVFQCTATGEYLHFTRRERPGGGFHLVPSTMSKAAMLRRISTRARASSTAPLQRKNGLVVWRTDSVAFPTEERLACAQTAMVTATALSLEELGWPPMHVIGIKPEELTFSDINRCLERCPRLGCCFQLSRTDLQTPTDLFQQEAGVYLVHARWFDVRASPICAC